MAKLHATDVPIDENLKRRWSPRAFSPKVVEPEKIRQLFEAARWSASSSNNQPWRFILATKEQPDEFEKLLACLVEQNRIWAKEAPVLILACAALNSARGGKPNRHAQYDTGQSVASLTFQATALGLFVHQMGGFDIEKARQTYSLPADIDPMAAIAIGCMGDASALSEELKQRELAPGTRNSVGSVVFKKTWGEAAY